MRVTTVPLTDLRTAMTGRALTLGFSPADADLLVDHFVDAEMRGATGHGVERLRWLAGRPGLDPTPRLTPRSRDEGLARYDAGGSVGYTALAAAIDAELDDPRPGRDWWLSATASPQAGSGTSPHEWPAGAWCAC